MWPGEMGYPPGYWESRSQNEKGENDFNPVRKRFIVSQSDYDLLTSEYQKWYRVVDVEGLYVTAYAVDKGRIDELLETHDPIKMRRIKYWNVKTGAYDWKLVPQFEIHHELVNDMRKVLVQLCQFALIQSMQTLIYSGWPGSHPNYESSLAAYKAAKISMENNLQLDSTPSARIGYWPRIRWSGSGWFPDSGYLRKHIFLTVTRTVPRQDLLTGGIEDLPPINPSAAHGLFRIGYWWDAAADEGSQIGTDRKFVYPTPDLTYPNYRYAFVEMDLEKIHWFWDGGADTWFLWEEWKVGPYDDWPPEAIFTDIGETNKEWLRISLVGDPLVDEVFPYTIDYNAYPESIFERDTINFIEV